MDQAQRPVDGRIIRRAIEGLKEKIFNSPQSTQFPVDSKEILDDSSFNDWDFVKAMSDDLEEASFLKGQDFKEYYSNLKQQIVPEDISREVVKGFFYTLALKGQTYDGPKYDLYDHTKCHIVKTEWGNIVIIPGMGDDMGSHLSLFMNSEAELMGYSGVRYEQNERIQKSFKIFSDYRNRINSACVYKDSVMNDIVEISNPISNIVVFRDQLYNPAIEKEVTSAPIFYRKLGFKGTDDASLSPIIKSALKSDIQLDKEQLAMLSKRPLVCKLGDNLNSQTVRAVKLDHHIEPIPYDASKGVDLLKFAHEALTQWRK